MTHKDDLEQKLRQALKEKESLRVSVLRMLLSSLNYKEIEKKKILTEDEFHSIVRTMIKQHAESIESFKKGQRFDLAEKEEAELRILDEFAPPQLSETDVLRELDEAVNVLHAKDLRDMGKVMKFLMDRLASRVDGKVLSEMVKKRLSSQSQP